MKNAPKVTPMKIVAAAPELSPQNFPNRPYEAISDYFSDYRAMLNQALGQLDQAELTRAAYLLDVAISAGRTVYVCGNGGSAAIANHWVCDFMKGLRTSTDLMPKIISLSANLELNMAIANDISYAEIFVYALQALGQKNDVLLTISSSGNSENIVRAIDWAKANGMQVISLDGFKGGRAHANADVSLHIPANNYGLVEDAHHAIMHMLAHYIRMRHMPAEQVSSVTF
jgi:D-sedoheptulose 7-phosphate isomerase